MEIHSNSPKLYYGFNFFIILIYVQRQRKEKIYSSYEEAYQIIIQ